MEKVLLVGASGPLVQTTLRCTAFLSIWKLLAGQNNYKPMPGLMGAYTCMLTQAWLRHGYAGTCHFIENTKVGGLLSHTLVVCWSKPTEWETPATQDKTWSCCFQCLQKRGIEGWLTGQKSLDRQGLVPRFRLHSDLTSQREWKLFHFYRAIGNLHT